MNPGKPEVKSTTANSVTLEWKPPTAKNEIIGYIVEVKMPNGELTH